MKIHNSVFGIIAYILHIYYYIYYIKTAKKTTINTKKLVYTCKLLPWKDCGKTTH